MTEEFISPLYDFVFAEIFGNQRNIDNTRAFLKTLLDIPEDDYARLTVENSILKRFFRQDKMGIVDLKLSTKSGSIIHIELQVEKKAHFKNRILYYVARLIGDQLKWGDNYGKLHQVISVVICDHVLLEDEPSYINQYELRNSANNSFTSMLKLVILELPKVPEQADSGVWPWLRFFTCKKKEEYEMLARRYPELEKPIFCVRKMSLIEQWREIRFHKNLWKEDERMGILQAQMDGHAEGRAEEKQEIALKMKNRGRPLAEIVEDTGLSAETIERL